MSSTNKTKLDEQADVKDVAKNTNISTREILNLTKEELDVFNRKQRLGIAPELRIGMAATTAGLAGLVTGAHQGWTIASLRYLAENAHRMPTTKGAWYFYYKRKNYVVLKDAIVAGFRRSAKYALATGMFFGVEAFLDKQRKTIDMANTVAAAASTGLVYAAVSQLSRRQVLRSTTGFIKFGILVGLAQDFMRYAKGNTVWYLPKRTSSGEIPAHST